MVLVTCYGFDNIQLTAEIFPYSSLVKSDCNQMLQLQRLKLINHFFLETKKNDDGRENYNSFVFNKTAIKKAKRIPISNFLH